MEIVSKIAFRKILFGVIALIIVLFLQPVLTGVFIRLYALTVTPTLFLFTRLFYWVLIMGIWQYAKKIEKQPILLWKEQKYDFTFYLISIVLIFISVILSVAIIRIVCHFFHVDVKSETLENAIRIFKAHKYLAVFAALTAGVTEELIFRGYLQPRLEILFKNPYVAIFVSSAIFGLLHFGFGTIINMVGPFVIGLIYAIYYQKYRNIKVLIISHFLWDIIVIFVSMNRY